MSENPPAPSWGRGGNQKRLKVLPVKVLSPPALVGFITVMDRAFAPLAESFIARAHNVANAGAGRTSTRR
jgi:hypothetical protein